MKMFYRGVEYEYKAPTLEVTEGEIAGNYRGHKWRYRYPRHILQMQPQPDKKYRGASYNTNLANSCKISLARTGNQVLEEKVIRTHLENIRRSLERRLEAAQATGDQKLIDLLKDESTQLERSA